MRRTAEANDRIAWELNEERVAALRRISQTLETLIAELHATADRVRANEGDDRGRAIALYRELRRRALQYRWFLEVQREAMGLRHHHRLDEFYRIPADIG
jgi:hypothetical protein